VQERNAGQRERGRAQRQSSAGGAGAPPLDKVGPVHGGMAARRPWFQPQVGLLQSPEPVQQTTRGAPVSLLAAATCAPLHRALRRKARPLSRAAPPRARASWRPPAAAAFVGNLPVHAIITGGIISLRPTRRGARAASYSFRPRAARCIAAAHRVSPVAAPCAFLVYFSRPLVAGAVGGAIAAGGHSNPPLPNRTHDTSARASRSSGGVMRARAHTHTHTRARARRGRRGGGATACRAVARWLPVHCTPSRMRRGAPSRRPPPRPPARAAPQEDPTPAAAAPGPRSRVSHVQCAGACLVVRRGGGGFGVGLPPWSSVASFTVVCRRSAADSTPPRPHAAHRTPPDSTPVCRLPPRRPRRPRAVPPAPPSAESAPFCRSAAPARAHSVRRASAPIPPCAPPARPASRPNRPQICPKSQPLAQPINDVNGAIFDRLRGTRDATRGAHSLVGHLQAGHRQCGLVLKAASAPQGWRRGRRASSPARRARRTRCPSRHPRPHPPRHRHRLQGPRRLPWAPPHRSRYVTAVPTRSLAGRR